MPCPYPFPYPFPRSTHFERDPLNGSNEDGLVSRAGTSFPPGNGKGNGNGQTSNRVNGYDAGQVTQRWT